MSGIIGKFKGVPIRRCRCGGCPAIYEEGLAKRYLTDENPQVYFSEVDAYFVECEECGDTEYASTLEEAIQRWNEEMGQFK
jgi:hypothetical protein